MAGHRAIARTLAFLTLSYPILGQTPCTNDGVVDGSSCSCPPGFGGSNCSTPACGGTIFQGTQRPLVQTSSSSFANLTAAKCSCENGWGGMGCNVCQTASACVTAFSSVSSSSNPASSLTGASNGQNETLTCNTTPRVYAGGEMSCSVINPSLQGLFPGPSSLNILRTLQSSLTPLPNVTAFGTNGSVFAQLFYSGVEQFYCTANNCSQSVDSSNIDWSCQNLQCTCIPGTSFCGAISLSDLTNVINGLNGQLDIKCTSNGTTTSCNFVQSTLENLFGSSGLGLSSCSFGECVQQDVIDTSGGTSPLSAAQSGSGGKELSNGVIAGLAVVGGLIALALLFLVLGWLAQRKAKRGGLGSEKESGGVAVEWNNLSYSVPASSGATASLAFWKRRNSQDSVILDSVSGRVEPGQMMAILGPSGAGKTTLVEILAGKHKLGQTTGAISFPSTSPNALPKIGFVPQQDILPAVLTVYETLLFAARLRLPESVSEVEKQERVEDVMRTLGIEHLRDLRVGNVERRGISGGEMRRVSIGVELVARPDVIILDEPTSGLDSVSAIKVTSTLHAIAHHPTSPTAIIASIHQPSSRLYQTFDQIYLLSHGRTLYAGPGGQVPIAYFAQHGRPCEEGYNAADFLLEVASEAPVGLFQVGNGNGRASAVSGSGADLAEKGEGELGQTSTIPAAAPISRGNVLSEGRGMTSDACATTFLTQLQVLSGREWKILRRDKTLFLTHFGVASILGVFCGGLYFHTGITIAGFQSRIGCLFFLGALIAFSSLSALYNIVEIRPLFLRERSAAYYSPTAWLLSRLIFDVIPLRLIPTIVVSTITYWMAGLAHDPAHFFKFLFILVLYSLAMALWNFLLACAFRNGGIAILLSALSALYQMTYAGFFVHLDSIPPVLRWLQWLCPLKYCLEALSVNEVGSGLMIEDSLEGVPVDVSATLIMNLLFGFGDNNYYRDVLVLFAFIAGFGVAVIAIVWVNVKERR